MFKSAVATAIRMEFKVSMVLVVRKKQMRQMDTPRGNSRADLTHCSKQGWLII